MFFHLALETHHLILPWLERFLLKNLIIGSWMFHYKWLVSFFLIDWKIFSLSLIVENFSKFFFLFSYLKGRVKEGEIFPMDWLSFQCPQYLRMDQADTLSQELHLSLLHVWQGPTYLSHHMHISRELGQKQCCSLNLVILVWDLYIPRVRCTTVHTMISDSSIMYVLLFFLNWSCLSLFF